MPFMLAKVGIDSRNITARARGPAKQILINQRVPWANKSCQWKFKLTRKKRQGRPRGKKRAREFERHVAWRARLLGLRASNQDFTWALVLEKKKNKTDASLTKYLYVFSLFYKLLFNVTKQKRKIKPFICIFVDTEQGKQYENGTNSECKFSEIKTGKECVSFYYVYFLSWKYVK